MLTIDYHSAEPDRVFRITLENLDEIAPVSRGDCVHVHDIFNDEESLVQTCPKFSGAAMQRYFVTMNPAFSEIAREMYTSPRTCFTEQLPN